MKNFILQTTGDLIYLDKLYVMF